MSEKTLLDILSEKGIELQKEGSVTRAFCPFHNDTGRPNFTVYPQSDSWFCFACNFGGDAAAFLSRFDRISYADAKAKIAGAIVNLETLQESLDGLLVPNDPPKLNTELNVLVSRLARRYLQAHPDKKTEVLAVLKEFDLKMLIPVTDTAKMLEILTQVRKKLGE